MSIFVRSTYYEIKKTVTSPGFWIAVMLALILMLTYGIYEDDTRKSYNIITAISMLDSDTYYRKGLISQEIFYKITHSSLIMYASAIAALCFTGGICQEKKNNVKRYVIYRSGKLCDTISKAFAAFITSGMAFVIASVICLIIICIFFPDIKDGDMYEMYVLRFFTDKEGNTNFLYNTFGFNTIYVLQLVGQFIYGGMSAALGFIVAAFCSSIYLAVCIPFFIGYGYVSICNSIIMAFVENKISDKIYKIETIYMDSGIYTTFWRENVKTWWVFLSMLILWIVAIFIYRVRMETQKDCGGGV